MTLFILAPIVAAAVVVIVILFVTDKTALSPDQRQTKILPNVSQSVATLPEKSASHPPIKLAKKSQPIPTNSWLSGLVFQTNHSVVYGSPWTYQAEKSGAILSYPKVKSMPDTVFAGHSNDLRLDFGAKDYTVKKFDDLSATVAYKKDQKTLGTLKLIQGSPYIFVKIKPGNQLKLSFSGKTKKIAKHKFIISIQDKNYGLWLENNASAQAHPHHFSISANDKPARVTLIALPKKMDQHVAFRLAKNNVENTKITHHVKGKTSRTSFKLHTKNGRPTLFGLVPRQYRHAQNLPKSTGSLQTLFGAQKFYKGNTFSYSVDKFLPPKDTIITKNLTAQKMQNLGKFLHEDIAKTEFTAKDSYGAGKQLYRAANLLELAHELHQPKSAQHIQKKLQTQLKQWLDPHGNKNRGSKYFSYDPEIRGLVGEKPSFGSEHFNDHNFHYGYFIYAASVLGRYDHDFVHKNKKMVTALIRDIASPRTTGHFPKLRSFDAYAGHAWADGYGDTPSGNNLESSSEAVNAAYAMYLWGKTTGNHRLQHFSQWLYQNQALAAQDYWTNIAESAPRFDDFKHNFVSLVWQGKLDSGTFFSNRPSAKLGIQLIPMSPGQHYLAADPQQITKNLAEIPKNPEQFSAYLLMYQSLANPQAALKSALQRNPKKLDSATSKTYLYAFLYNQARK
jgi:endoglucanase Acf2